MDPSTIEKLLKGDGWPYNRIEDKPLWQTGIKTSSGSFRIFITLTEHWIFLQMPLSIKVKEECRLGLYHHLLRKNFEMNFAKFVMEEEGTVSLNVEVPTENMQGSHFLDALNMLSSYIEKYYAEILTVSQNIREAKDTLGAGEE